MTLNTLYNKIIAFKAEARNGNSSKLCDLIDILGISILDYCYDANPSQLHEPSSILNVLNNTFWRTYGTSYMSLCKKECPDFRYIKQTKKHKWKGMHGYKGEKVMTQFKDLPYKKIINNENDLFSLLSSIQNEAAITFIAENLKETFANTNAVKVCEKGTDYLESIFKNKRLVQDSLNPTLIYNPIHTKDIFQCYVNHSNCTEAELPTEYEIHPMWNLCCIPNNIAEPNQFIYFDMLYTSPFVKESDVMISKINNEIVIELKLEISHQLLRKNTITERKIIWRPTK